MPEKIELDFKIEDPVVQVDMQVLQQKLYDLELRIEELENP